MILDGVITSLNKPVSSNECSDLMTMMMFSHGRNHYRKQTATSEMIKHKPRPGHDTANPNCCLCSDARPLQVHHRHRVKRLELVECKSSHRSKKRILTTITTTKNHRQVLIDSSSHGKRRRVVSGKSGVSSVGASSSSCSSSGFSQMKRQSAQADLSILTMSSHPHSSVFSTQNKFLFNSTCSSCLNINCENCCQQFQLNDTIETQNLGHADENKRSGKRKTPFDATFSEFLSSTPIVRAASTSTRRVRSIFANKEAEINPSSSSFASQPKPKRAKPSRLNKIVRTATSLFAGVSSANYLAPETPTIHNNDDNFKNFGDFLVWYV